MTVTADHDCSPQSQYFNGPDVPYMESSGQTALMFVLPAFNAGNLLSEIALDIRRTLQAAARQTLNAPLNAPLMELKNIEKAVRPDFSSTFKQLSRVYGE